MTWVKWTWCLLRRSTANQGSWRRWGNTLERKLFSFFFFFIADVISQAMGAIIQTKETILLFGMNHNSTFLFFKEWECCIYKARSVTIWTTERSLSFCLYTAPEWTGNIIKVRLKCSLSVLICFTEMWCLSVLQFSQIKLILTITVVLNSWAKIP